MTNMDVPECMWLTRTATYLLLQLQEILFMPGEHYKSSHSFLESIVSNIGFRLKVLIVVGLHPLTLSRVLSHAALPCERHVTSEKEEG